MSRGYVVLAWVCAALGALACDDDTPDPAGSHWVRVARDPNYEIWIDTSRITRRFDRGWDVWYRTDHAQARLHKSKEFDRELVHSVLRCDTLDFKVVSVDMSKGGGSPVAIQRADYDELDEQPWRGIIRGTAEEIAARAACHYAAERIARYQAVRGR